LLGPSVVTLTLGPRDSALPPWNLPAGEEQPSEWLVSLMIWAAIAVGAVALLIGMRALAAGWLPSVRRITLLGVGLVTATIMVPPMTSADVLMYAAYGRLQLIGRNPYEITPAEIFRSQFDPVLRWTERPWWDTPSVYGPITSWTQWAANALGGENMHDVVFWLQVSCALPFVLASLGVIWMARGAEPGRQARAALLTIANPLLIWAVVAGAHNEAISVMFAVAGMMFLRRYPFLSGLLIGIAGCAKLSIGLWGLAMLWAYRRQPKQMILICLGAAIPMVLAYVVWEPQAFFQVLRNGGYVSVGSWAHPLYQLLAMMMPYSVSKIVVAVLSYALLVLIAYALSRVLPWQPAPGIAADVDPKSDPLTIGLRTALILGVAWLLTAMYTLSWYDLQIWMPMALLGASKLDRLMVLRGAVLSASYVPGRSVEFGAALMATSARIRDTLSPMVQVAVMVAILLWWKWPDRQQLWPLPSRRRRSAAQATATDSEMPTDNGDGASPRKTEPGRL
jgi:alpha-1,6-mannosyltransferase